MVEQHILNIFIRLFTAKFLFVPNFVNDELLAIILQYYSRNKKKLSFLFSSKLKQSCQVLTTAEVEDLVAVEGYWVRS